MKQRFGDRQLNAKGKTKWRWFPPLVFEAILVSAWPGYFFDAVSKATIIPLVSRNPNQKESQDVQLELLQQYIQFHLDQMEKVREIAANIAFCFAPTLWFQGKVKLVKACEMVEINGAYKHDMYDKLGWTVCV